MSQFLARNPFWIRKPKHFRITQDQVQIRTEPQTDLWQRTYYGFRSDSAPLLLIETEERYFSFTLCTEFDSQVQFDQCGVLVYQDADNWIKASIEYENERIQRLGSVVTNLGYSDWATTDIPSTIRNMWYRLSRREQDFCLESSLNGQSFQQMRICHLHRIEGPLRFGLYACSPGDSSFVASFSHLELSPCLWAPHEANEASNA